MSFITHPLTDISAHLEQLSALYSIASVLAERASLRPLLREVLDIMKKDLAMNDGMIVLVRTEGREIITEHSTTEQTTSLPPHTAEIINQVLCSGKPSIPDHRADPTETGSATAQHHPHPPHPHHHADGADILAVPIMLAGETVGCVLAESCGRPPTHTSECRECSARLLSVIAAMIAQELKGRHLAERGRQSLEADNQRLKASLERIAHPSNMIGNSDLMRRVYQQVMQIARADSPVLILGEPGTGKTLVASAIHVSSDRAHEPFLKVNCSLLKQRLVERELFGYQAGAFHGARDEHKGTIDQAGGGTLLLSDIAGLSPTNQVRLLRLLNDREYEQLGGGGTKRANCRIITSSSADLEEAVENGTFRADLYYRLGVFPIHLPSLRERKEDIVSLANHFVEKYSQKRGKEIRRLSTTAIHMLTAWHWPGNVAELADAIAHAVEQSSDDTIHGHHLPPSLQLPTSLYGESAMSLQNRVNLIERDAITDALKRTRGNMTAAARELEITPRIIRYKIKKLGIEYQRLFKKAR